MIIIQFDIPSLAGRRIATCRRGVMIIVLLATSLAVSLAIPLAAQQPAPARVDSLADSAAVAADLGVDANNSGSGTWMQLTPTVGYNFNRRWSIAASLPFYYLNAASSIDAKAAATGIGDVLATLTMDLSTDSNTFYATFTAGAPTGNTSKGFGAGKATWDVTGYLATQVDRVVPYLNAGVSNNVNVASEAQSSGAGSGRLVPGIASSNFVHTEAGMEFDLARAVSLTGSVYGVFASSASTTTVTGAGPPRRGPRGRLLPSAGGAQTIATDDVSDHGLGGVLWAQVTDALGMGLWVSHSLVFQNYTTVSVSANLSFAQLARRPRSRQ